MIKYLVIIVVFFASTLTSNAQTDKLSDQELEETSKISVTVGILQGGGSLIGMDLEALLTEQFGIQVGAGMFGYGAGLNFHLEPSVRSSFLSMQYWHQGIGDSFVQSAIGPTFVYRSEKWFTFQIGMGIPTALGPGAPNNFDQPPLMLLYSIGGYFPL
jgi:hypothetical protein